MALSSDIMRGGFSAISAKAIQGQANGAVAAAGTTQATATSITQSTIAVTSGTGGVVLPSAEINDEVAIVNLLGSGTQLTVYPPSGERINGLAANAGFLLADATAVKVKKFTTTRWMGFLSA